jgi:putative transcriptional regulator
MATRRRKIENPVLASVHEAAVGLHRAGLIDDAKMREFDALCLEPVAPPRSPA